VGEARVPQPADQQQPLVDHLAVNIGLADLGRIPRTQRADDLQGMHPARLEHRRLLAQLALSPVVASAKPGLLSVRCTTAGSV
jgi:hypothetical protein